MILCDMQVEKDIDWTLDHFGGNQDTVNMHASPMLPTNKLKK